jgi:chromosome segregation ATPase
MSLTWSLQALLVRHEAYVAEAEEQKALMDLEITRMIEEKKELEANNSTLIDENRNLLDQLEGLNNAAVESDAHTQSLTATLQQTQAELHRLNTLAARTERLEREIEEYEQEQAILHASISCKTESEKSATLRWQEAERKLATMENQLERIELRPETTRKDMSRLLDVWKGNEWSSRNWKLLLADSRVLQLPRQCQSMVAKSSRTLSRTSSRTTSTFKPELPSCVRCSTTQTNKSRS